MNALIGTVIPWVGKLRIALNADGSPVDTGQFDVHREVGTYMIECWVVAWLNIEFIAPWGQKAFCGRSGALIEGPPPWLPGASS